MLANTRHGKNMDVNNKSVMPLGNMDSTIKCQSFCHKTEKNLTGLEFSDINYVLQIDILLCKIMVGIYALKNE